MATTTMTDAQRRALTELVDEWGGRVSAGLGIPTPTIRALERLGMVEVAWGKRRETMSPQGWTGRVYVENNWVAFVTDAGREAVA